MLGRCVGLKRNRSVAGVVFDWDGVLLDSLGASFNIYNRIFRKIGTRRLTQEEFLELQSPNWYEFYENVGVPRNLWSVVDAEWLQLYEEEDPKLYPDAKESLVRLERAGYRLALVSNGSEARVGAELKLFGLAQAFESVLCGRSIEELKPSPVMLQRTMDVLGLKPMEVVYVGDAPVDIQASRNAGVRSIAIARGPILAQRLRKESPDYTFDGLGAMTEFLADPGVRV